MIGDPPVVTLRRGFSRPSAAQLAAFAGVPTGFAVDAQDGQGAIDHRIKPLWPEAGFAAGHAIAFELIHGDSTPSDARLEEAGFYIHVSTAVLGRLNARETFLRAMVPRFADRPRAQGIAQLLRTTVVNQGRFADGLRQFPKDGGLRVRGFDMGLLTADSLRSYDFSGDTVAHAVASIMLGDWDRYGALLPAVERKFQRDAEGVPEAFAQRVRDLPRMIVAVAAWKRATDVSL